MAYSNVGATINQLQGLVATAFGDSARQNQGLSLLPEIVRQIATRAELDSTLNLRVSAVGLFDNTNHFEVSTTPAVLIASVFDNTEAAANTPVIYDESPTEGTTVPRVALSMAASKLDVTVYLDPISMTDLYWSVIDGDALTNSSTLAAANSVRGFLVYAN